MLREVSAASPSSGEERPQRSLEFPESNRRGECVGEACGSLHSDQQRVPRAAEYESQTDAFKLRMFALVSPGAVGCHLQIAKKYTVFAVHM